MFSEWLLLTVLINTSLGLSPGLTSAICHKESRFLTKYNKTTKEPATLYDKAEPSHGICQIKVSTARFAAKTLLYSPKYNKYISPELKAIIKRELKGLTSGKLLRPTKSAFFAGLYLKYQSIRYDNNVQCVISAYNAGHCSMKNKSYIKSVNKRLNTPVTRWKYVN